MVRTVTSLSSSRMVFCIRSSVSISTLWTRQEEERKGTRSEVNERVQPASAVSFDPLFREVPQGEDGLRCRLCEGKRSSTKGVEAQLKRRDEIREAAQLTASSIMTMLFPRSRDLPMAISCRCPLEKLSPPEETALSRVITTFFSSTTVVLL